MKKTNIKLIARQVAYALVGAITLLAYYPMTASAAQITVRSVAIDSSAVSASTKYTFAFTTATAGIKGITFQACSNASGASCTPATGFSGASAVHGAITGLTGTWVDDSQAAMMRINNSTGSIAGTDSVIFNTVTNPSTTGVFYIWMSTYSDVTYSAPLDTGTVVASTGSNVTVTANVDETLTFTVGASAAMTPGLTSSTTASGSSTMSVLTNAATGYSVTYTGTTLTSGLNTIAAMSLGTKQTGTAQFGINLRNNTAPDVGVDPTSGATPASDYNTIDSFKFVAGTTPTALASRTGVTNTDSYTISYIADIPASQAPGAYTAGLNLSVAPNF
jgi:hypothetical protein